jgi:hypothetical protein
MMTLCGRAPCGIGVTNAQGEPAVHAAVSASEELPTSPFEPTWSFAQA